MTNSTTPRARRTTTSAAPRISMRRGRIMNHTRLEAPSALRRAWIGSSTV